jgi:hypothetical protein
MLIENNARMEEFEEDTLKEQPEVITESPQPQVFSFF